jgi:pimeloyl-ACP methyl ester carboxylesterase
MSVSAKLERDDISSSSSMTNILFVHGSCAASSQYDDLIRAMSMKLLETQEQIQSYPKISKINCYSYDQLGCAESKHPTSDWESFSSSNLLEDLRTIVKDGVLANSNKSSSLFLVGHSHGCSQVIQLVNSLSASDRSRIKGVILISGALKDGPGEHAKDGGHWIFKFVPMFLLRKMQPSLSQSFFQAAVHPKHKNALKERALNVSDTNDMMFCKAFYRQQVFATSEEAAQIQVSCPFTIMLIYIYHILHVYSYLFMFLIADSAPTFFNWLFFVSYIHHAIEFTRQELLSFTERKT